MPQSSSEKADPAIGEGAPRRLTELTVTARLMQLQAGLYCVVMAPSPAADAMTGLPGVRLSVSPGPAGRPEAVEIRAISPDGWLSGFGDAALVRVTGGPAFVMVTIYQSPLAPPETAPSLRVLPLLGDVLAARPPAQALPQAVPPPPALSAAPREVDVIAHIQARGDVGGAFGDWIGEPGSGRWIEGVTIAPRAGIAAGDIEYQAVLGKGWVSPWVEGGQFCGSRGMALPLLGLRVRLRGAAAETHEIGLTAAFVGGARLGPVAGGEACETDSLEPLEAVLIEVLPKGEAARKRQAAPAKAAGPRTRKPGRGKA